MKKPVTISTLGRAGLSLSAAMLAAGTMLSPAFAGGFINSSQSSVFNGLAYAGMAAPGSRSAATLFLNPATLTSFNRLTIDTNYTFGIATTNVTATSNVPAYNAAFAGRSGDAGLDYFVPASYIAYPLTNDIVLGLSINSTYGNSTKYENRWRGSLFAATSKLRIITATPSVAYRINDMISIGVGLQVQYASARQTAVLPGPPFSPIAGGAGIAFADGVGFGWTAGITLTPWKGTQIGLGWRSFVDQPLEGRTVFGPFTSTNSQGTLNLPNRVNLSLRQTVTPQLDLLASVEWQNWGRIGNSRLDNPANAALGVLPFGYKDGWFFSVGGEYKVIENLTVRAGIGYEISPITDAVRRYSLPDNDRLWLSAGLSYDWSDRLSINGSYSYLYFKRAPITQSLGALVLTGEGRTDAHLLSIGLTSRWGAPPPKETTLVKKF